MYSENKIWAGKSGDEKLCILPKMANRHGLIAGATGTGKTITLKVLAESFSDAGVPVFLADVKGDLAGMCQAGIDSEDMQKRIERFGLAEAGFSYKPYPTVFWDLLGKNGLPLRTTVSEFGPVLFSKLLDLNKIQSDLMDVVFRIADDEGLLLIDLKDLKAMLQYVEANADTYRREYGNIGKGSVGAITRGLVALEDKGGERFFGEPAIDLHDWMKTDAEGRGTINVLDSRVLINSPEIYGTFLLWMMTELFEVMPEVGDLEKPKFVFFFDEAHLLFSNASKTLLQKIEQVVKLIRSKGIGIYFITQSPADIPDSVLAQLGNKVQHALHAYTPAEQKAIRAAARSYRVNPEFDTEEVLQQLGTGEAIVSFLQEDGTPSVVKRAKILPPQSKMGSIDDITRQATILACPLKELYSESVDRDSAYELLNRLEKENAEKAAEEKARLEAEKQAAKEQAEAEKQAAKEQAAAERAAKKEAEAKAKAEEKEKKANARRTKSVVSSIGNSAAGTVGREIGNTVGKTIGGTFGKKIGGNVGASLGRGILKTLFRF